MAVGRTASQLNIRKCRLNYVSPCREWPKLILDELSERVFARHCLHFLDMRELLLGERSNSRPQDFAVKPVFPPEMVIYRSLVHSGLSNDSPHARIGVAVIGKQPLCSFENPIASNVGWSRHSPNSH